MLSVQLLYVAAALCLPARAQPVSCKEDAQCTVGYYCETDAHICRECLSCQDLKRKPPLAVKSCIKSVAECGSCNNGLVVNRRDDVNAECVPPETPLEPTPSYVWPLIGIGVMLFLALVVGIFAYLLRNPEIFKTAGSSPSGIVTAHIRATAPEAPPPYNQLPQSPYHPAVYSDVEPTTYNEEEQFIKPPPSRPQDTRESAGNQAARVYERAIYERDQPLPSPESPVPEYTDTMTLPNDDDDDETRESGWRPDGTVSNGDVNANIVDGTTAHESEAAGTALPALLSTAQNTTLIEPPSKKRCVRQDSRDSDSCGDSTPGSFPRSPSPSQGGPPYSYITQITNVVHINTNK